MSNYEIIGQAYDRFLQANLENPDIKNRAMGTLKDFQREINNWDSRKDISFIKNYMSGSGAEAISSGRGHATRNNKLENMKIFMEKQEVQDIVKQFFLLRKSNKPSAISANQIGKYDIFKKLERTKFEAGNRPELYLGRFLLMTFPEKCTTIASYEKLKATGRKLGISVDDFEIPFINLQYQIRSKTNDYLKEKGLYDKVDFWTKYALAWYILG